MNTITSRQQALASKGARQPVSQISSVQYAWRDDFNGAALGDAWEVIQLNTGGTPATVTVSGGVLAVTSGTATGETILRSREAVVPPCRVAFYSPSSGGLLSQRIANQEIYLEIVNAAGDMAAGFQFDGTTATNAKARTMNGGTATVGSAGTITTTATGTAGRFGLTVTPEDVLFFSRTASTATAADTALGQVHQTVPDPNDLYYVQIRVKNTSTVTVTTLRLDAISAVDHQELLAELTAGPAIISAGLALPVTLTSTTVALTTGTATIGQVNPNATGTQANAWNAAAVGAGGTSTAVDLQYLQNVAVFGNTSGASTLTLQVSQDNSNFYDTGYTIAANGNFGQFFPGAGARYFRLKSSAAVTITATIAGKG